MQPGMWCTCTGEVALHALPCAAGDLVLQTTRPPHFSAILGLLWQLQQVHFGLLGRGEAVGLQLCQLPTLCSSCMAGELQGLLVAFNEEGCVGPT
jgi:hypothetical protein